MRLQFTTLAQNLKSATGKEAKPPNRTVIAERFIALRRTVGLSQSRLGKYVGLCRQAVSEIENCHVMPHDSTWARFCEYESRGREPGIEHLPKHYWRDRLVEDQLSAQIQPSGSKRRHILRFSLIP